MQPWPIIARTLLAGALLASGGCGQLETRWSSVASDDEAETKAPEPEELGAVEALPRTEKAAKPREPRPPTAMAKWSGVPRPDAEVPAGAVTVRLIGLGGFSEPIPGRAVTLHVEGPTGATRILTETTAARGEATFVGLDDVVGGGAIARVELGGQTVESLPIELVPHVGSSVVLVEGAPVRSATPDGRPSGRPDGRPAGPKPGVAFPRNGAPKGSLTVAAFDLTDRAGIPCVDFTVTITPPEGKAQIRKGTTDKQGKLVLKDLLPPKVPEGSTIVAEAILREDGAVQRSKVFTMDAERGMVVVLTTGRL